MFATPTSFSSFYQVFSGLLLTAHNNLTCLQSNTQWVFPANTPPHQLPEGDIKAPNVFQATSFYHTTSTQRLLYTPALHTLKSRSARLKRTTQWVKAGCRTRTTHRTRITLRTRTKPTTLPRNRHRKPLNPKLLTSLAVNTAPSSTACHIALPRMDLVLVVLISETSVAKLRSLIESEDWLRKGFSLLPGAGNVILGAWIGNFGCCSIWGRIWSCWRTLRFG